jgi:hypothetical protein
MGAMFVFEGAASLVPKRSLLRLLGRDTVEASRPTTSPSSNQVACTGDHHICFILVLMAIFYVLVFIACRFTAIRYAMDPDNVTIHQYSKLDHVNAEGQICHGPMAENLVQLRHEYPAHLSYESKEHIRDLILKNPEISSKAVLESEKRHFE